MYASGCMGVGVCKEGVCERLYASVCVCMQGGCMRGGVCEGWGLFSPTPKGAWLIFRSHKATPIFAHL